ncbi:MAG: chorismate synthase, partial [Oscillospiraceae bacterium]|nr:chorismate synthase [Oscillospiraceae bacterium]
MSSAMGNNFKITVFGQSHSKAIGVVIDGVPAGIKLDLDKIEAFMARRAPSGGGISTARKEADHPEILSGIVDGVTCGAPICAMIANGDTRSKDYSKLRDLPRPMHADFAAAIKYNGANDIRGGGQFSGRLTAPLCFAGAVAMQL